MPPFKNEISSKTDMPNATIYAARMQDIIIEAVNVRRRHGGQSEAVFGVARDLGMNARRVTAFLRGEIGRVWADEYDRALHWHADFCRRQAERHALEAKVYAERAQALKDRLG